MLKATLIASTIFSCMLLTHEPPQAEACGVKISAKAPKAPKARSKHPSSILIVGRKDSSLISALRHKKHRVEYASSIGAAKRKSYRLIITDESHFDQAKERFDRAEVVQRKSGTRRMASRVETVLARRAASSNSRRRRAIAAKNRRLPTKVGSEGTANDRLVVKAGKETPTPAPKVAAAGKESSSFGISGRAKAPEPVAPKVEPKPERVAKAKTEPKPARVTKPERAAKPERVDKPERTPKPEKVARQLKWTRQVRFGTNSTNLNRASKRRLRTNAKWLEQNPDASIVIEGHTDSVGDEAYNMDLSERRANIARDFLLGLGIDGSRISVDPKGEQEPAFEPSTSGKNRRIELIKQ